MRLTDTQIAALKALMDHGGEGAILRDGSVLAAGEVLGVYREGEMRYAFSKDIWRRLAQAGFVEEAGARRIRLAVRRVAA